MARYKHLMDKDGSSVYAVKPTNLLERLRMAWLAFAHPEKTPVLMVVDKTWALEHLKPADFDFHA